MRRFPARILTLLATLAIATTAIVMPAAARETRTLADRFTVEIGFVHEPAIQADTNGMWLRITEGDQPVEGLEQTLQAEVIYGDAVRLLPVIPSIEEAGVYTSTFIPVQPGDYTFRISGSIADLAIEESFTSAPEGVAPVDARIDYEFPTAAQGWVARDLAMPAALGGVLLAWGIVRYVSRRGEF
jgi:hypothetical protein